MVHVALCTGEDFHEQQEEVSEQPTSIDALLLISNRMNQKFEFIAIEYRLFISKFTRAYRYCLTARDVIMMIWTILVIELSLRWSKVINVNEVTSTGQLIPLIIGISGLLPIASQVWRAELSKVMIPA